MPLWTLLLLVLTTLVPQQATEGGLRVWVRDLDDRGVADVRLQIVDAAEQRHDARTDAQGVALITPLPGGFARILGATAPDGQPLLMDENDPAGGLRIPLQPGVIQDLDLRLSDGLLFVEPVAEPETPPSPLPAITTPSATTAATDPRDADPSGPAPADRAARSSYAWVRSLVLLVVILIAVVALLWQAVGILRARRAA
ncbi:MAG TPA: hypothetical protein VFZ66_27795 [Herpetosiphonaceae bacterium]